MVATPSVLAHQPSERNMRARDEGSGGTDGVVLDLKLVGDGFWQAYVLSFFFSCSMLAIHPMALDHPPCFPALLHCAA